MPNKKPRNRIRCLRCEDIIESIHVHDFRWCSCGAVAVDGGPEYMKRLWPGIPGEKAYEEMP